MRNGYLRLTFQDDFDGTGKLLALAESQGFSGRGGAWFGVSQIEEFAKELSTFPLPDRETIILKGGFWKSDLLDQEHLALEVYPIDRRGHIGVQIRMASELWKPTRPQSQMTAKVELVTSYQPLLEFSNHLQDLVRNEIEELLLEGEAV